MERVVKDIQYAVRNLVKRPGFTAVAVIALALGIGANTAIFSVVNAVLLRKLPYKDSDQLVVIWEKLKQVDQVELSPDDYKAYEERSQSFARIAASERANFNLTGVSDPVRLEGQRATANLFETLQVAPQIGRTFSADEDNTGARVAVLSYQLWQSRFAGDTGVVGREISLDGQNFKVIGVMPAAFQYPAPINNNKPGEIWTPRSLIAEQQRGAHNLLTIGRLKPGVSWASARAEFEIISTVRAQESSKSQSAHLVNLIPLPAQVGRQQRTALYVLLGAVALVLLIACANVANLLLALAAGRKREIALRLALGARRIHIVRQLLTESLLLSLTGGAVGLLLAVWLTTGIQKLAANQIPRVESIGVDAWVLLFTLVVSVVTGVVFGLVPALQASRVDLNTALKENTRGSSGSGQQRLRSTLVVSEVALSLLLLAGAGLMIKSFWQLQQVNPGFDPNNLLSLEVTLPESKYAEPAHRSDFYTQSLAKIAALPGVKAAELISSPPLSGRRNVNIFPIEGRPEPKGLSDAPLADFRIISPNYFRTMGIAVEQGRMFENADESNSQKVTVISASFANQYGAGENLLGRRINIDDAFFTVVGIVSDVHQSGLDEEAAPHVYVSYKQLVPQRTGLVVRTSIDPISIAGPVRAQVLSIDPDQPIYNVNSMTALMSDKVAPRRLNLVLLGSFAVLALLLAAIGLYGLMSNLVLQRTGEIGLRMALGARRGDVLRLVVMRGLRLAVVGAVMGIAASLVVLRFMSSLLVGVASSDPLTLVLVSLILLIVAAIACLVPAERATKVDPLVALKYE
ncbi:MAG TPA: ABC transporter permease [Pyrinomonadaceae bacterium]|nr:ABC transporter permease [Pyrinomonadaceae bacterium]